MVAGARMPIPGNAEFVVYFVIEILFAIFWIAFEKVDVSTFMTATTVLTFGYMLSRGIAKASRVLEQ
jgi:hypothetical protein